MQKLVTDEPIPLELLGCSLEFEGRVSKSSTWGTSLNSSIIDSSICTTYF